MMPRKLAEQAVSNSQVTYMAPKATQSVVYVENAKKLPNNRYERFKSINRTCDYCSNYFFGISGKKKGRKIIYLSKHLT